MRKTDLRVWSPNVEKALPRFHRLVRAGKTSEAAALLSRAAHMSEDWCRHEVDRESYFLSVVDASTAFAASRRAPRNTPRQALVYGAVLGTDGDLCGWMSPASRKTIVDWGKLYYGASREHLDVAFDALVLEGLFAEVHPLVFAEPTYFCTFDCDFLSELKDGDRYRDGWASWVAEYDSDHGFVTWRRLGLCAGQGSQGPSGARYGPCLGTSCSWFDTGDVKCNWELVFNPELRPLKASKFQTSLISYGGPDAEFASRLHRALERKGVRTWFFPRDSRPGEKLHKMIRDAINENERVILICSRVSLARVGVLNEIQQALAREAREGGTALLLPVSIDSYLFEEWRPSDERIRQELLDRVVIDFSDQSDYAFRRAVDRLVYALAKAPKATGA